MANRINVKLILELKSGGMSQNEIARIRHMSRTSVSTVVNIAKERSISFEDIRDLNDDVIYRMFFPEKMLTPLYLLPSCLRLAISFCTISKVAGAMMAGWLCSTK